ncbi:MAG: glycosyltransferase, partial [Planctomycetales bacterium]
MHTLAIVVCVALGALACWQAVMAMVFTLRACKQTGRGKLDEKLPRVAILLALRGADPHLKENLQRLIQQDYPDYEIHIVIDSKLDPAWKTVQEFKIQTGTTKIYETPLSDRFQTCSLHCASLIQLARELDESFKIFVLIDGDVVAHTAWLRELVRPLSEGDRASTGTRWYMPPTGNLGSVVRYVWNSAAVPAMYWCGIPWGGSLAGRTEDLHPSRIIGLWQRALAVDAP